MRAEVESPDATIGQKLPPEHSLAERFGVSIGTIRRAVGVLAQEGLVQRRQGHGTVIVKSVVSPKSHKAPSVASLSRGPIVWGHGSPVAFQELIDQALWGEHQKEIQCRSLERFDAAQKGLPSAWKQCDVLQISTDTLHLPSVAAELQPIPEDLRVAANATFAPEVIEQCSSLDGQLLMLPIITNPTVAYAHVPSFERAGVSLPTEGWSWSEFRDSCVALQEVGNHRAGLMRAPYLTFEPLLWSHGCDFFDAYGRVALPCESFCESMTFLRDLLAEDLAYDMYEMSSSPWLSVRKAQIATTFIGPKLTMTLGDLSPEWSLLPLPHANEPVTPVVILGLVIPRGKHNVDSVWDLLRKIWSDGGFVNLGDEPKVFAAHPEGQRRWRGNGIQNHQIMQESLSHSRYMPTRKGWIRYASPIYQQFTAVMHGDVSVNAAWETINHHLESFKHHESGSLLLA